MPDISEEELEELKRERPFFDAKGMPEPTLQYVAWIDIMGSASIMARSLVQAAIFLGKLHTAALRGKPSQVQIVPVVDGVYAYSKEAAPLLTWVKNVMRALAVTFIFEEVDVHRFLVRGGIAFGPIWTGSQFPDGSSGDLSRAIEYKNNILVGPAIAAAHAAEGFASPYGLWVDESARHYSSFGAKGIPYTHLPWWGLYSEARDLQVKQMLIECLRTYFAWAARHASHLLYPPERMAVHLELVEQYFSDLRPPNLKSESDGNHSKVAAGLPDASGWLLGIPDEEANNT